MRYIYIRHLKKLVTQQKINIIRQTKYKCQEYGIKFYYLSGGLHLRCDPLFWVGLPPWYVTPCCNHLNTRWFIFHFCCYFLRWAWFLIIQTLTYIRHLFLQFRFPPLLDWNFCFGLVHTFFSSSSSAYIWVPAMSFMWLWHEIDDNENGKMTKFFEGIWSTEYLTKYY